MEDITREILSMLSLPTLNRIKAKCESYLTYCTDYKQVNSRLSIKTRQRIYAELLEEVQSYIVIKQIESEKDNANSTKNGENNNNVTSTMENVPIVESKQKEKKAK